MTMCRFATLWAGDFFGDRDSPSLSVGSSLTGCFVNVGTVFEVALAVGFGVAIGAGFRHFFETGMGVSSTNSSEAVDQLLVTKLSSRGYTHSRFVDLGAAFGVALAVGF